MWTPTALASEFQEYRGVVWRVVEAQHRISTNRLTDNLEDQQRLEELADEVKPNLPKTARGLHYLLAAPFRYGHSIASRFRRANERPGLFYSSEHEATAIAETAYWRLRFFARSPGLHPPSTTSEHLSFTIAVGAECAIDLTQEPFASDIKVWTHPKDYDGCQELAGAARQAGTELIRTISARDRKAGANIVILDPTVFKASQPKLRQTWHLRYDNGKLLALSAFPGGGRYVFDPADFGIEL
ncbi:RES family NAD+ phosphorylase [Sphingorhabdus contaminans]|uniref:RES domain-containing protein n=1 Tax=Sphingorhabdus contaminans TaxID=1343899 RepID=A0A553WA88_9SPHN|nr:RES family NAD+ phosphorylase [Sphingorhabdus contaminans]TSB01608.1 RES domain-containing protein [Sphingorhabdus contaminans]